MRYPPEKVPDPVDELPNPELNPLLNPTLGRNLGRWAEVYFTSPPEKREEAVGELLRELKENPAPAATGAELSHAELSLSEAPGAEQSRIFKQGSEILTATSPSVQCAECGHRHPVAQRFCGMCGAALAIDALEAQGEAHPFVTVPRREPVFAQTSIFGFDTTPVSQSAFSEAADISWLREKNLAGAERSSGARKLIPALVAMAAIGILIYAQSRPQKMQPRPAPATTAATPRVETAPQPSASQPTAAPAPAASQAAAPGAPASTSPPAPANPAANTVSENSAPANAQPAAKPPVPAEKPAASEPARELPPQANVAANAPSAKEQAAAANTAAGAADLALATEYLNGKRGPRDSAEAAKFLWKAVGKENPSAILLLSDMYLVGDGVPRSCDQARLLLNAAVRKNVPQAAQKLRNLQTAGCP